MLSKKVIEKYNVPSPRYTSYPTILDWNRNNFEPEEFTALFMDKERKKSHSTSVYIHLPFCESLCTFCGCHKYITKRHSVEAPYIDSLLQEWEIYKQLNGDSIAVSEVHIGGGTPTFFSANELKRLLSPIMKNKKEDGLYSFEGHPNYTSKEQLETLYQLGFRRVSFGIQDYSPHVQQAIHRIQSYEQVKEVTESAREMGYETISHDLVFGLPRQRMEDIESTIDHTLTLRPNAISLYSYAHVPWVKGTGQRGFSKSDLPGAEDKRALYERAKERLLSAGYLEIGFDHFALPQEPLAQAMESGDLNRTFMGYTTSNTDRMIGLGASAISEYDFGYAQNNKDIKDYQTSVNAGQLPIVKGHIHSHEDATLKTHILELMCRFETTYEPGSIIEDKLRHFDSTFRSFVNDGLLVMHDRKLIITRAGKPFVRNICMTLDPYNNKEKKEQRFSRSI